MTLWGTCSIDPGCFLLSITFTSFIWLFIFLLVWMVRRTTRMKNHIPTYALPYIKLGDWTWSANDLGGPYEFELCTEQLQKWARCHSSWQWIVLQFEVWGQILVLECSWLLSERKPSQLAWAVGGPISNNGMTKSLVHPTVVHELNVHEHPKCFLAFRVSAMAIEEDYHHSSCHTSLQEQTAEQNRLYHFKSHPTTYHGSFHISLRAYR